MIETASLMYSNGIMKIIMPEYVSHLIKLLCLIFYILNRGIILLKDSL